MSEHADAAVPLICGIALLGAARGDRSIVADLEAVVPLARQYRYEAYVELAQSALGLLELSHGQPAAAIPHLERARDWEPVRRGYCRRTTARGRATSPRRTRSRDASLRHAPRSKNCVTSPTRSASPPRRRRSPASAGSWPGRRLRSGLRGRARALPRGPPPPSMRRARTACSMGGGCGALAASATPPRAARARARDVRRAARRGRMGWPGRRGAGRRRHRRSWSRHADDAGTAGGGARGGRRSNKQAAAQLYLSPKTIEAHLSRIPASSA